MRRKGGEQGAGRGFIGDGGYIDDGLCGRRSGLVGEKRQRPDLDCTVLAGGGESIAVRLDVYAEDGDGGAGTAMPEPDGEEEMHGERAMRVLFRWRGESDVA